MLSVMHALLWINYQVGEYLRAKGWRRELFSIVMVDHYLTASSVTSQWQAASVTSFSERDKAGDFEAFLSIFPNSSLISIMSH